MRRIPRDVRSVPLSVALMTFHASGKTTSNRLSPRAESCRPHSSSRIRPRRKWPSRSTRSMAPALAFDALARCSSAGRARRSRLTTPRFPPSPDVDDVTDVASLRSGRCGSTTAPSSVSSSSRETITAPGGSSSALAKKARSRVSRSSSSGTTVSRSSRESTPTSSRPLASMRRTRAYTRRLREIVRNPRARRARALASPDSRTGWISSKLATTPRSDAIDARSAVSAVSATSTPAFWLDSRIFRSLLSNTDSTSTPPATTRAARGRPSLSIRAAIGFIGTRTLCTSRATGG